VANASAVPARASATHSVRWRTCRTILWEGGKSATNRLNSRGAFLPAEWAHEGGVASGLLGIPEFCLGAL